MITDGAHSINVIFARMSILARDRGLVDVPRFVDTMPHPHDPTVLLLGAAGADLDGLRDWLLDQDPALDLEVERLESTGRDEGTALAVNRTIVVFQCGKLLLLDAVEAATPVVARPRGTFAVVLVGAEILRGADDLDLVRRGIWRVLIGEPGVEWAGQDLAAHGCLLWSDTDVADVVADQVAADMSLLRDWVLAGAVAGERLVPVRAAHTIDLAERELARRVAAAPLPASVRVDLPALRSAAADLRVRLLRRLDGDLAIMESQLAASLQMLEQDLLAGAAEYLAGHEQPTTGLALTATVSAYLADAGRTWRTEAVRIVADRLRRTSDESVDLLDGVDWAQVNAAVGENRGAGYPDLIMSRLELRAPMPMSGPDEGLSGPPAPGRNGQFWVPALRRAAYGGVAAAASLVVLGPLLLPVVAAGAIGAAGGAVADIRLSGARGRRAALDYANAVIASTMGEFSRTVREQVRAATTPLRRAVAAEFTVLDTALGAAAERAASTPSTTRTTRLEAEWAADAALLAQLRADLSAATSVVDREGA